MDQTESLIGSILLKLQLIFVGMLLVVVATGGLYMLALLTSSNNQNEPLIGGNSFLSENPNIVSGFANESAIKTGNFFGSLGGALNSSVAAAGSVIVGVGRFTGNMVSSVVYSTGEGIIYVVKLPGRIVGSAYQSVANMTPVSIIIRPAEHDQVLLIDPNSPELVEAQKALPVTSNASTNKPRWPMHGVITTEFGVPEPPYQPIHTGIDISDSNPAGVTPVLPFRSGVVVEAVHSAIRLGNHVVVDHGNGVTSVYGHLSSISVKSGQTVNQGTTLGYQGNTGVSTGPHLHFEIRVNDKVTNPHNFIPGQP